MHMAASLMTVMARPFYPAISVPANVRVRWWCSPPGGVGDRHLVTVPQGVMGDRLPWGGEGQGGGDTICGIGVW